MNYVLYARPGWGSVLVEAQLAWYRLPFETRMVDDLFESRAARDALAVLNPRAQLPTLVLPNGTVLTESAAITLHLGDVMAAADAVTSLVPPAGDPTRDAFLRWLIFIVANIYPTYTYGDAPERFVVEPVAAAAFRERIDDYALALYLELEVAAVGPWFLGESLSAIDFFVATLVQWRPGPDWFRAHAPRLFDIAQRGYALESIAPTWGANFPSLLTADTQ